MFGEMIYCIMQTAFSYLLILFLLLIFVVMGIVCYVGFKDEDDESSIKVYKSLMFLSGSGE